MISSNDIIEIFYEQMIPQINSKEILEIDGVQYNIGFNVNINNKKEIINNENLPMLNISDVNKFNKVLTDYINEAIKIFDDPTMNDFKEMACGSDKKEQIKYLLMILFSNAREDDFKNPVSFIVMQLQFLKNKEIVNKFNDYKQISYVDKLDSYIEVTSKQQTPNLETPYVFSSRLVKNIDGVNYYYDFPNISYGINDNNVYIYTIQGKNRKDKEKTKYEKNINRLLYKINDGVVKSKEYLDYKDGNDSYYPENIIDVTHANVVALTIFLSVLEKMEYQNIIVVDYLPLRYLSKTKTLFSKIDKKKQKGEIDNSMHLKLKEGIHNKENLINEIYNSITNNTNNKGRSV